MLLGHTSFNWALRHVRAYVVSLVVLLEPVGATVLAVLVLGSAERPTVNTVIGGLAILFGMALLVREQARRSASARSLREGG
jgi:drug/metabolite transporter (DMT)-like permease